MFLLVFGVVVLMVGFFIYSKRTKFIPNVPLARGDLEDVRKHPNVKPWFGHGMMMQSVINCEQMIPFYHANSKANNFRTWQIGAPGLNLLVTHEPEHLQFMYDKEHFSTFIKGEQFFECFEEVLGHGIFAVDGDDWREKRKVSSYMFSARSLRDHMSHTFVEHGHHVVEILSAAGGVVDIQPLFQSYTFDSVCKIAFGTDVHALRGNERDNRFQRAYDVSQKVATVRFFEAGWKLRRMFNIGMEKDLKNEIKIVDDYVYDIIDKRLASEVDEKDMLTLYIEYGRKKGRAFDRKYLRDMVLNFIIAGRDTTAAASMWLFYELAKNPQYEQPLLDEIEKYESGEYPTYDEINHMHFLRAVFYETLRLHPSVPMDGKFAASDVYVPHGDLFLKKGTLMQCNIYSMNRSPNLWGKDAEEFRPERWLKDGKFQNVSEFKYPTFNIAPRGCLGKRMAELEASFLVVSVLPKLKLRLVPDFEPEFCLGAIMFSGNGMKMTVEPR